MRLMSQVNAKPNRKYHKLQLAEFANQPQTKFYSRDSKFIRPSADNEPMQCLITVHPKTSSNARIKQINMRKPLSNHSVIDEESLSPALLCTGVSNNSSLNNSPPHKSSQLWQSELKVQPSDCHCFGDQLRRSSDGITPYQIYEQKRALNRKGLEELRHSVKQYEPIQCLKGQHMRMADNNNEYASKLYDSYKLENDMMSALKALTQLKNQERVHSMRHSRVFWDKDHRLNQSTSRDSEEKTLNVDINDSLNQQ